MNIPDWGLMILGALFGAALLEIFARSRLNSLRQLQAAELETLEAKLTAADVQHDELQSRLREAQRELIAARNDALRQQQQLLLSETRASAAEAQAGRLPQLEQERQQMQQRAEQLHSRLAEAEARLAEERKNSEEKLALLHDAKERLSTEFQNLAQKIFEEKSEKFTAQNRANLDSVLSPLRQQLGDFKQKVEDVYSKDTEARGSLLAQIAQLKHLNERIGQDALNLTRALKGETKTQGNWGEVILERVLEESGLTKGREYEIQVSLADAEGRRYQPDVLVRLPGGKDVVVDAKVSLSAYERYCAAETDEERQIAIKAHIGSIRQHMKGLSEKNYDSLEGVRSLDFVLMFLPVEAAFLAAVEQDAALFRDAFERNIIIVCPSTLLATLRTIHNTWRTEYQNQNALKIADEAGKLHDKFVDFVKALDDVGVRLEQAQDAFGKARGRLNTGTGNLIRRVDSLKKLGAKAKKNLPLDADDELPALGDE